VWQTFQAFLVPADNPQFTVEWSPLFYALLDSNEHLFRVHLPSAILSTDKVAKNQTTQTDCKRMPKVWCEKLHSFA